MKSLEFVLARFPWYSLVALTHKFTSSTNTNYTRFSFPAETENRRINEITSPRMSKKTPQSTRIGLYNIYKDFTVFSIQQNIHQHKGLSVILQNICIKMRLLPLNKQSFEK